MLWMNMVSVKVAFLYVLPQKCFDLNRIAQWTPKRLKIIQTQEIKKVIKSKLFVYISIHEQIQA